MHTKENVKACMFQAFIASRGFVHRGLAARNIFMTYSLRPKIGDFGLSRPSSAESYVVQCGTMLPLRWSAPESISNGTFSEASDV